MIFKQLQIELPTIKNTDIEKALQRQMSECLETQLGFDQDVLPFHYLELHPELIYMKNQAISPVYRLDDYPYVQWSLGCFHKDNSVRKYLILRKHFIQKIVLFVVIVNTIAFALYDYSTREGQNPDNTVSLVLETICNVFFAAEIVIQSIAYGLFLGQKTYLRNIWSCLNLMTFLCTQQYIQIRWSIYLDEIHNFVQIFRVLRLLRLLRLLQEIAYLKDTFESFFQSFLKIHHILIPLLIVLYGYALIGLHFLNGTTAFRCAKDGQIDLNIQNLCGYWTCPDGYECIEQYNREDLRYLNFNYGYNNFDTIFESILAVFMYINATGWSGTTFMFWKAASPSIAAIYFISMNYIFSNLVLASLYESFMVTSAIKNNLPSSNHWKREIITSRRHTISASSNLRKAQVNFQKLHVLTQMGSQSQQRIRTQVTPAEQAEIERPIRWRKRILMISDYILIIVSSAILCSATANGDRLYNKRLYYGDLVMNYTLIILTMFRMIELRKFLRKFSNYFDLILSISLIVVIILEQLDIQSKVFIIIKSAKILRLLELIYFGTFFGSISILLRCLIATILQIKHLIILWIIFALMLTIIGQEFFSYYVNQSPEIAIHYNGLGNAFMAVFNIFYNEEWHVSMYQHANYRPTAAFIFYIICIIIGQIFFMRLLQALFLNEFGKNLNEVSNHFPKIQLQKRINDLWLYLKKKIQNKQINSQPSEDDSNAPLQDGSTNKQISEQSQSSEPFFKTVVEHNLFRIFILFIIAISSIKSAIQNPLVDPNSSTKLILDVIFYFVTAIFVIELAFNMFAYGVIGYLKQSLWTFTSLVVVIANLVAVGYGNPSNFILSFFDSLRIFAFLKIGADQYLFLKEAQQALMDAFAKMIQLSIFTFTLILIYGVFALQLLKGQFNYCTISVVIDKWDCFDNGGNWVNQIFGFDNIFESMNMLFIVATTEAWLPLMQLAWSANGVDMQPIQYNDRVWAIFFQVFFFIGNTLMLGMFITLIVNTYIQTRDEAQNLNLLNDKQREWFQIKKSIQKLQPLTTEKLSKFKQIIQWINLKMELFFLLIIGLNIIILSIFYARMNPDYRNALLIVNQVLIFTQFFEIVLRTLLKQTKIQCLELLFIIYSIVASMINNQNTWIISVAFQTLRGYRLAIRFKSIDKLFHAIFAVLPNALSMLIVMFTIMYCYIVVGMDMFAYLRPQSTLNSYDINFREFFSAAMALIRVASAEQWWSLMLETASTQNPSYACNYIETFKEFQEIGFNGCGTKLSYLYFISFHMIFSLMVLNLLIASILGAYDEFTKNEESAISKYQLQDVLDQWAIFDKEGKGYISYKLFWRLSSQIAIIFGVDQSDLLDINNKKHFLQALKIPIYEEIATNILCYKFHDVIISLTRISVAIKYGVVNLEPDDPEINKKVYGDEHQANDKLFRATAFTSGDMASIIYIQSKFREWKNKSLLKDNQKFISGIGDLRSFVKPKAMNLAAHIRDQNEQQLE